MSPKNNSSNLEALVQRIDAYINELKTRNISRESDEWYLLNNLTKFQQSLNSAESKQDVKNASSILSRFCVESFNWDTDNFKKCVALSEEGFTLAKTFD